MAQSLQTFLADVPDFRRGQGRRYPLDAVLTMITMGIMSGRYGYRELGRFIRGNAAEFIDIFKLERKDLPSHVTIRTILLNVDFEHLRQAFEAWARQHVTIAPGDVLSIDGKALGSTVTDYDSARQDFICIVSLYSQRQGAVRSLQRYHNGHQSEIPTVRELLAAVGVKGITVTMDALHCKKKRSKQSSRPRTRI